MTLFKDQFVSTNTDKTNQEVQIFYCSDVTQSACLSLMFEIYSNMLDQSLVFQSFEWKDLKHFHAVFAKDLNGQILSGITFKINAARISVLTFAFSTPESRNRGISKICFKQYLAKSIELQATRTLSVVSKHNQDVIKNQENKKVSYSGPEAARGIYLVKF